MNATSLVYDFMPDRGVGVFEPHPDQVQRQQIGIAHLGPSRYPADPGGMLVCAWLLHHLRFGSFRVSQRLITKM
ncbi:hypothetical protein [Calidithermus roseus]|uniref:hypothetical protein n=1 Tax=Calidithermus roseus TaxID=1644118 RepID=UPI000E64C9C2|nr:hypothetical protein [Calidithermus roseus]